MNISGVTIYPSAKMDNYDLALRDLHRAILENGTMKEIAIHQAEVLRIRNEIAKELHSHSWCGIPAENRW